MGDPGSKPSVTVVSAVIVLVAPGAALSREIEADKAAVPTARG